MKMSVLVVGCWLGAGLWCSAVARAEPLDATCPVDWRAVPVGDAVRQLARRLGKAYILDASVSDEMMARPIRFAAAHLDGRQALRWTVRVAGMEAVFIEDTIMIARPERLPMGWRLAPKGVGQVETNGSAPAAGDPEAAADRRRSAESRRADLAWTDAPLSRVTRDVSERFGIDILFHPRILEDPPLVRLTGEQLTLAEVRNALGEQLNAVSRYHDGVVWVEPRDSAASMPVGPALQATTLPALAGGDPGSVLFRPVEVRLEDGTGEQWGEALARAAGIKCRIQPPPAAMRGPITARGSLAEVLEAGRVLWGWEWEISPAEGASEPFLLIQPGKSGRSVP